MHLFMFVAASFIDRGSAILSNDFQGVRPGRFDGKVCLVTGGTAGIGEHAAHHLVQEGCAVVITGRREEKGQEVVTTLKKLKGGSKLSPSALFVKMDVSNAAEVEAGVAQVDSIYGRLDAVFVNAGIIHPSTVMPGTPLESWSSLMSVNVDGAYYTMRFTSALMTKTHPGKESPGGSMVLCSSIFSQSAIAGYASYITSKHALEGLKKAAVHEFAVGGVPIRVNSVNPSFTHSDAYDKAEPLTPFIEWVGRHQAGGRVTEQREVSSVVAWLLSDDSAYVSAQSVFVDGGAMSSFSPPSEQKRLQDEMAAFLAGAEAPNNEDLRDTKGDAGGK